MARRRRPASARLGAGLRLRAEDSEDIAVISACLQDALVAVRDLAYDRDARVFLMVANRFRWEGCGNGASLERILCGVAFDEIEDVVYRGFQRREEDRILSLLAIQPVTGPAPGKAPAAAFIDLEFAAGATIRLSAAAIRCRARDFGEPWPTVRQPGHLLDALE
jgi:Protein of unknown function (DUF2948)